MRCYFHSGREAVGVCFYCHRGVCEECSRLEDSKLFCKSHNIRMYSLEFAKFYLLAIDLAREAGVKGVRTQDLIAKLEQQIREAEG